MPGGGGSAEREREAYACGCDRRPHPGRTIRVPVERAGVYRAIVAPSLSSPLSPAFAMALEPFGQLPEEYLHLVRRLEDEHGLDLVPLRALAGGRTGAFVFLVSASSGKPPQLAHFVLKLDRLSAKSRQSEIERHRLAMEHAPASFAGEHMPQLAFELVHGGTAALLYTVAGHSLQRFRTLASLEGQSRLETLFAATCDQTVASFHLQLADAVRTALRMASSIDSADEPTISLTE